MSCERSLSLRYGEDLSRNTMATCNRAANSSGRYRKKQYSCHLLSRHQLLGVRDKDDGAECQRSNEHHVMLEQQ